MPCPWLESSSVHGTCHGIWLIYPVTFHNLVLLIHDDNTTFSKEDTFQAIMLKVKYKKTCPGGETCRGAPAVQQVDPLYTSSSLTSTAPGHLYLAIGHTTGRVFPVFVPQNVLGKHLKHLSSSPGLIYLTCCASSCSFCVLVVLSEVELHAQRGCSLWGQKLGLRKKKQNCDWEAWLSGGHWRI